MTEENSDVELIRAAIVRLRARILGVVLGLLGGTVIFLATVSLLVQGGEDVGKHLQLLSNYCPGYTVTWPGAFLGFFYGALYGALAGYFVARVYNFVANFRKQRK